MAVFFFFLSCLARILPVPQVLRLPVLASHCVARPPGLAIRPPLHATLGRHFARPAPTHSAPPAPAAQKLKAALDDAIAALARRPEAAAALWERLLAAVVVAPGLGGGGGGSGGGLPRYDLTYQLTEVEAREEDFAEALAFVRLLNALMLASGGALPDGGRPYAHFTAFVRVEVLGSLHQRAFRCAALLIRIRHAPGGSAALCAMGVNTDGRACKQETFSQLKAACALMWSAVEAAESACHFSQYPPVC